jgi:hypothetical protein
MKSSFKLYWNIFYFIVNNQMVKYVSTTKANSPLGSRRTPATFHDADYSSIRNVKTALLITQT